MSSSGLRSKSGRSQGHDPLSEKLLATQPPRQRERGARGPIDSRTKIKIGLGLLAVISLIIYANFIGPDTSSIGGLEVGECFEAPDGQRVKRVTMQDCALPHEGQVVAKANGLRADVDQECADAINGLDPRRIATLPRDATFGTLTATISHRCVVISPSGNLTEPLTGP